MRIRSSLRSACDGGKNTTACGPRHAALVCQTSSPRFAITVPSSSCPRRAGAGHSAAPRFSAHLRDVPRGRRQAAPRRRHLPRPAETIVGPGSDATLPPPPTAVTRGSCAFDQRMAGPAVVSPRMDREAFCRQSNVVVVAGKGGVGKTTVTAALGRMAADIGLDVLVVELDGAGGPSRPVRAGRPPSTTRRRCSTSRRHGRRSRDGARASRPTTRFSSIWRTTACAGSPSASSRPACSTSWRRPSRASARSSCSARSSSSSGRASRT